MSHYQPGSRRASGVPGNIATKNQRDEEPTSTQVDWIVKAVDTSPVTGTPRKHLSSVQARKTTCCKSVRSQFRHRAALQDVNRTDILGRGCDRWSYCAAPPAALSSRTSFWNVGEPRSSWPAAARSRSMSAGGKLSLVGRFNR